MIFDFLLSLILITANSYFCSIVSGSWGGEIVQWVEIGGFIIILALFIFISGYGKSFCRIFASPKKQKNASLQELKKTDEAISYAIKAVGYIGLFFLLTATSYFYINFWNTQTLGFNLATIILSLFYMLFINTVLFTLRSKNKKQMIMLMTEPEAENKSIKPGNKHIWISVMKTILAITLILVIGFFVIKSETRNETDFNFDSFEAWIDIPSFVELFIISFALLAVSGNFKIFGKSVKTAFLNQKIDVTQKNLYVNAVQTLRNILLMTGIACTLIGFMAMLVNLEDKSALGYNMQVALIVSFYAVVCCLILLPMETKLCRLSEGNE